MKRRSLITAAIGATVTSTFGQTKRDVTMAVCNAVSYSAASLEAFERFVQLDRDIAKIMGVKMAVDRVDSYEKVATGLKAGSFDIAFVHPSQHALKAIASGQYHLAALPKAHVNYRASFLVRKDSPIQRPEQLAGKVVSLPDPDSSTSWLARAAVAEIIPDKARRPVYKTQRYQEAIPMAIELHAADAGATGSEAEVAKWLASGNRALFTSRAVPVKYFLVHDRQKAYVDQIQSFLVQQTDVSKIGITDGFIGFDQSLLIKAGEWLSAGAV